MAVIHHPVHGGALHTDAAAAATPSLLNSRRKINNDVSVQILPKRLPCRSCQTCMICASLQQLLLWLWKRRRETKGRMKEGMKDERRPGCLQPPPSTSSVIPFLGGNYGIFPATGLHWNQFNYAACVCATKGGSKLPLPFSCSPFHHFVWHLIFLYIYIYIIMMTLSWIYFVVHCISLMLILLWELTVTSTTSVLHLHLIFMLYIDLLYWLYCWCWWCYIKLPIFSLSRQPHAVMSDYF